MCDLSETELEFSLASVVDPIGKVFFWNDRVFRLVHAPDDWMALERLIGDSAAQDLFDAGLIETWVPSDVRVPGSAGVLEHKRVEFISVASEWTSDMLWDAAKMIVSVATILAKRGLGLKDAHPWNVLFDCCTPKMIDVGSIVPEFTTRWLGEFRSRFVVPLCLLKHGVTSPFGRELLGEHHRGVGQKVINSALCRLFPLPMGPSRLEDAFAFRTKSRTRTVDALERLGRFVETLEPYHRKERWATYSQESTGATSGQQKKMDVVRSALDRYRPRRVLDMGTNKGLYAFMSEESGAAVAAFDYEEYTVNHIYHVAKAERRRVLPAVMDFKLPTPPSGVALGSPSSFERYRADLTLVLGMMHHLSLHQALPFSHIAEIISRYTKTATVVEFVHADDQHLATWKITSDYSMDNFIDQMRRRGYMLRSETRAIATRSILVFDNTP